jgi:uncharacterized protein (TIGR03067 family)
MTAIRCLTLGLAVAFAGSAAADDKKADGDMLVGKWKLTDGKKAGNALGDDAKKGYYEITKDTIKIFDGMTDKAVFVMKYTLDTKASPAAIDIEITEGPVPEVKGSKAKGIVEVKGDEFKICYEPMGGDRPTKFDGEKFYSFTLKKEKAKDEKKDK